MTTTAGSAAAGAAALPARVAIVHEWLTTLAGSERVLAEMLAVLPHADVFAVCDTMSPAERAQVVGDRPVRTTAIQRLPFVRRRYRAYLPLMPLAIEQLDLGAYDLVISSSHAVAKGVLTGPDQLHLCVCYSPLRYAWDLQHAYLEQSGLTRGVRAWLVRYLLHRLRLWDVRSSAGVDEFVAISAFIARRIAKAYRREATVLYPPVDTEAFTPGGARGTHYVTASRLVPYKRIDLLVRAFASLPDRELVVVGDGPEMRRLRAMAGPNVRFRGHLPHEALVAELRAARAFLFAAVEDFGIAPLEAQAVGTPVIALGRGGARETVRGLEDPTPTGVFFPTEEPAEVVRAIRTFEREGARIDAAACRANAERFSRERFRQEFGALVSSRWLRFAHARAGTGQPPLVAPSATAPEAARVPSAAR